MKLEQLPADLQELITDCIKHSSMTVGNDLQDALEDADTIEKFVENAVSSMIEISGEAQEVIREIQRLHNKNDERDNTMKKVEEIVSKLKKRGNEHSVEGKDEFENPYRDVITMVDNEESHFMTTRKYGEIKVQDWVEIKRKFDQGWWNSSKMGHLFCPHDYGCAPINELIDELPPMKITATVIYPNDVRVKKTLGDNNWKIEKCGKCGRYRVLDKPPAWGD